MPASNSLTQLTQHRVNHLVPSQTKCSIRESHPTLHLISVAPLELGNHARPPYCDHFTAVNVDGTGTQHRLDSHLGYRTPQRQTHLATDSLDG